MKKKVSNLLQQLAPVAKQRHKNPCLTLKKLFSAPLRALQIISRLTNFFWVQNGLSHLLRRTRC